ncbi:hypothetical protein EYE40_13385 [Glaciihabitans arcticus]|uniref:Uncharacterized protein n=1 Tax=Glaciihabitans arcticus TaxID=2668039 RepID=A0A4Q9GUA3_9MICO|nr:hypothetical protein [Glaciihabitans arcticus]TBN58305.1 hypothetical protein EYE40_13385 [Glaciihabitans arcticus]
MSTSAARRRATAWAVVGVVLAFALVYGVRVAWLFMMATEGDVPVSSSVQLPSGATIVSEKKDCANGGCWVVLRVEPPEDQSAEDLAATLGATPQLQIAGNFVDPRTISVQAHPVGRILELRLDYWSQKWVP